MRRWKSIVSSQKICKSHSIVYSQSFTWVSCFQQFFIFCAKCHCITLGWEQTLGECHQVWLRCHLSCGLSPWATEHLLGHSVLYSFVLFLKMKLAVPWVKLSVFNWDMASGVVFLKIYILGVCFHCAIVGQALSTANSSSEDKREWACFTCSGENKLTVLTSSEHECLESPWDHCSQKE